MVIMVVNVQVHLDETPDAIVAGYTPAPDTGKGKRL